ncbi:MAG: ParA family protein [Anaerolineales bacterium]
MPRTIAVANQKGGVGKTTTVHNLGAALVERGKRVLLVDLDPQAALTASVGLDPYEVNPSTNQLLLQEQLALRDLIHPLGQGLWLLPANVDLAGAEFKLATAPNRTLRLRQALLRSPTSVDLILIDTPPNLGLVTINALTAADQLMIPVGCQYLALRGVRAVLETTRVVHERLHPDLRLLGILPTMYQPESEHGQKVLQELRRVFGQRVFDTVIEFDEAVAMAPAARQSVLRFRPDSPASLSYRSLADEVLYG